MSTREIAFIADPVIAPEAEGVDIYRSIGSERLIFLDPFMLLDHLKVDATHLKEPRGFPRHPHRGIETLTYVFEGVMAHRDSLGNEGLVSAGGSQWMTAGAGIFHEEMLHPDPRGNRSLQIWFNLPADQKFKSAGYQGVGKEGIPMVQLETGGSVAVIAGEFLGQQGAFRGIAVQPHYFVVTLSEGETVSLPAPTGWTACIYPSSGIATINNRSWRPENLVVLGEGEGVTVAATSETCFVFVTAKPLNEPVMQYRSLVMNTPQQVGQALADLENGTFA